MVLSEIIEQVYLVDHRVEGMDALFAGVRHLIPFASAQMMPVDPDSWQLRPGRCCELPEDIVELYLRRYYRSDPIISQGPARWVFNHVVPLSNLTPALELAGSEFADFSLKVPFVHALSVLCGYRGVPMALFRLCRVSGQDDFSPEQIGALGRIAPHLGRALYLRQLAARPDLAVPRGVLVIGADRRLAFMSSACEEILGTDFALAERVIGEICSHRAWFSTRFGASFRPRPIPLDEGSLLASFDTPWPPSPESSARSDVPCTVRAFVLEPFMPRTDLRRRLERYGLTSRELDIALAVVQGLSYKVIARNFVITEQTVKDHMKNVFDKVGVRSAGALAAHIVGVRHTHHNPP